MAVGAAVGANSHDDRRRLPAQTLSHAIIFREHHAIKNSDPTHLVKAACNSPGAGGAASRGPMIEKRKRAQRSRLRGSTTVLNLLSWNGDAGGATTGEQATELRKG